MRFEDLSPEDQKLVTMDFPAEMEKEAMDKLAMTQELYQTGMNKLAQETAEEMDKAEAEEKKEEENKPENKLDEGEKKEAAVRGAFIARGYVDGLKKLGSDKHGDELHYLYPFVAEKLAAKGADPGKVAAFLSKLRGGASKAGKKTKEYAGKGRDKAMAGAKATKEHLKKNKGAYLAGAGGAGAGYAAGKASD